MKVFTKSFLVLLLSMLGVMSVSAETEKVHATFENPSNTNTSWDAETRTFTWSTTYYNQLRNIGLPSGDISGYKKLVVDCTIKSGEQFRILFYKGGSNLTLYAKDGVNEFNIVDELKAIAPNDYNEYILACDEICLSGNNAVAPGEAVINDVYLETYDDEGEKVYATFENPSNTNTTWNAETKTFTWSTTYYNQLRNIGLPNGDITKYRKLVVDCTIKSGEQFRVLFYKGGSNLTLYAKDGVNEFIIKDELEAIAPNDYNEYLLACDEICLSGNNAVAPGEAVINEVYLETYPQGETPDIPEITYEEDPGKPEGEFVDFTEAFPSLNPKIGIGEDTHPIVLGNGDVVVGQRTKDVIADLSEYSKLTIVTSPNLKLVVYMNHEIDAKQNAGDYTDDEAGKYVFLDVQANENGIAEIDLTQYAKQDLNCICLPWDNNNKGTVWYLLLTKKPAPAEDSELMKEAKALAADADAVAVGKLLAAIAAAQESGDESNLQAAIDQFKADNADMEKDETAKVATNGWKKYDGGNAGVCATQFAPAIDTYDGRKSVQLAEVYETTVETTGTIIYQDITGLANGKYKVGFYGNAFYTSGRGFDSTMEDGSNDVAYVFANDQKEFITARIATSTSENNFRQFDVEVTDGTIKLGMGKEKPGTNWHTMQIYQLTWFTTAKEAYAAVKADMTAAVAAAKTLAADENKTEGKEAFATAIADAEAALASNMLTVAELEAEVTKIKEAGEAFKKANYFIDFAEGSYYVIDAESGKFMAAGHDYGTRGIVNETGLDLAVSINTESRMVTFETQIKNNDTDHFLGSNLYMDAAAAEWALEYQGFGFYITNGTQYINIDANDNLVMSDTPREWIIVTAEGVMEQRLSGLAEATAENPVDATFLIQGANFNRNDARNSAWSVSEDCTNKNLSGGNQVNNCAESYHSTFTISQVLNNAPKGVYKLTAQGFYRQDEGLEETVPVFFIGDQTVEIPVKTGSENNMSDASASFTNGLYTIEPIEYTFKDGELVVGVKNETATNQWIIFDNFRLTYYGPAAEPQSTITFNFADPNFRENIGETKTDSKGWIYNETFTAEGATLQITGGSAPSRIYVDADRGQNLVTYTQYTTLTFNAPEGKAITKIEFTAAGNSDINNFTASSGTIEGMIWTGNAEGVRFTQGGTSYLANAILTLVDKTGETAALPAIEYTKCANIAEFNALAAGTYAEVTLTDAEVIGKSADGCSTVWVQDATGGCWIQYTSLNDKLNEKTKINGTVFVVKRATSGNPQMKEAEATLNSQIESAAIEAYTIAEGTIKEVNIPANLNKVVKISGATLTMTSATAGTLSDGETTIDVNNGTETANQLLHKIAGWENDKVLENIIIEAILSAKSTTANQLLPIAITEAPKPVPAHTWDFTQWSEATVANLKADAAASMLEGWSDVEKKADAEPTEASKDNCFWAVIPEGGELKANGVVIEELKGLIFGASFAGNRSLAIAVNYPSTSLGEYNGPAYLWLGGKNFECFTIPAVKRGTVIKMGVESHKPADARGVQLLVAGTQLTDPEGAAVAAPTTYTEQTWAVPAGDSETVDVVVKNTNGCHIYFIDADIDESIATGISNLNNSRNMNGTIYNLNGQKMEKMNKGLYIVNGKKVFVK